jgi:hypothetical protein
MVLKMEAAWYDLQTLVSYHTIAWFLNLEDYDLNLHRRENLKSHTNMTYNGGLMMAVINLQVM